MTSPTPSARGAVSSPDAATRSVYIRVNMDSVYARIGASEAEEESLYGAVCAAFRAEFGALPTDSVRIPITRYFIEHGWADADPYRDEIRDLDTHPTCRVAKFRVSGATFFHNAHKAANLEKGGAR